MSRTYRSNIDGHLKQQADTLDRYFARAAKEANHKVRQAEDRYRQSEPVTYNETSDWFHNGLLPALLKDESGSLDVTVAIGLWALAITFIVATSTRVRAYVARLVKEESGQLDVDMFVLLSMFLLSLCFSAALVGIAIAMCNFRVVYNYVARSVTYLIGLTKYFAFRFSILVMLGLFCWVGGARALTNLPLSGNYMSDQQVSPIGSLADMGSLFAAVFVLGGFAVGHTLDRKQAAKRGNTRPVPSPDAALVDRVADSLQITQPLDSSNGVWYATCQDVADGLGLSGSDRVRFMERCQNDAQLSAWENEGGAIYDAN